MPPNDREYQQARLFQEDGIPFSHSGTETDQLSPSSEKRKLSTGIRLAITDLRRVVDIFGGKLAPENNEVHHLQIPPAKPEDILPRLRGTELHILEALVIATLLTLRNQIGRDHNNPNQPPLPSEIFIRDETVHPNKALMEQLFPTSGDLFITRMLESIDSAKEASTLWGQIYEAWLTFLRMHEFQPGRGFNSINTDQMAALWFDDETLERGRKIVERWQLILMRSNMPRFLEWDQAVQVETAVTADIGINGYNLRLISIFDFIRADRGGSWPLPNHALPPTTITAGTPPEEYRRSLDFVPRRRPEKPDNGSDQPRVFIVDFKSGQAPNNLSSKMQVMMMRLAAAIYDNQCPVGVTVHRRDDERTESPQDPLWEADDVGWPGRSIRLAPTDVAQVDARGTAFFYKGPELRPDLNGFTTEIGPRREEILELFRQLPAFVGAAIEHKDFIHEQRRAEMHERNYRWPKLV